MGQYEKLFGSCSARLPRSPLSLS